MREYVQFVGEKRKLADSNLDFLKKMGVLKQKGKTVDSVYYVLNSDFDVTTPQVTPQVTPKMIYKLNAMNWSCSVESLGLKRR